jgi:hypothetical protein
VLSQYLLGGAEKTIQNSSGLPVSRPIFEDRGFHEATVAVITVVVVLVAAVP